jgi:dihydroorotase
MPLLIRAATILDPNSPFHLQTKDILIDGGIIRQVKHRIDVKDAEVFEGEGKFISRAGSI